MSADVGFTPGCLVDAAAAIGPVADPVSESVSAMGEELASLCEGVNGPCLEALGRALTCWNDSLGVLYEDLGRLGDALVGFEESFMEREWDSVEAVLRAAWGA